MVLEVANELVKIDRGVRFQFGIIEVRALAGMSGRLAAS